MSVEVRSFGTYPDGQAIKLYTISNGNGMQVSVTNVGAALVKVICPDKNGTPADVVLGFDEGEAYLENVSFFGCVIGPNANRIADASFCLDGCTYKLDANNGKNNLHSHKEKGWHKRLWKAEVHENDESVTFYLEDGDGSLGFPGNKKAAVTYSLDSENALKLHYHADSDKRTLLNLTNHSYFNLEGHNSGSIEGHELWMGASAYTPADEGSIPAKKGEPLPDALAEFSGVELLSDNAPAEGEDGLYDKIRNKAEVLSGDYPPSEVLEAALYGNKSLDDLMGEWNQKWSDAQSSESVEITE